MLLFVAMSVGGCTRYVGDYHEYLVKHPRTLQVMRDGSYTVRNALDQQVIESGRWWGVDMDVICCVEARDDRTSYVWLHEFPGRPRGWWTRRPAWMVNEDLAELRQAIERRSRKPRR